MPPFRVRALCDFSGLLRVPQKLFRALGELMESIVEIMFLKFLSGIREFRMIGV